MDRDSREQRMLQYFRSRDRNVDGLEKLIEKFDCEIINVKKMENEITLDEMINEAEDILEQRKRNFSEQVKAGNMKKENARYHYDCMTAILENLKKQRDEH